MFLALPDISSPTNQLVSSSSIACYPQISLGVFLNNGIIQDPELQKTQGPFEFWEQYEDMRDYIVFPVDMFVLHNLA